MPIAGSMVRLEFGKPRMHGPPGGPTGGPMHGSAGGAAAGADGGGGARRDRSPTSGAGAADAPHNSAAPRPTGTAPPPPPAAANFAGGALVALPAESARDGAPSAGAAATNILVTKPAYVTKVRSDLVVGVEHKVAALTTMSYFGCGLPPFAVPSAVMAIVAATDSVDASAAASDQAIASSSLVAELEAAAPTQTLPHALAIVAKRLKEHFAGDAVKRAVVLYHATTAVLRVAAASVPSYLALSPAVVEQYAWLVAVAAAGQDEQARSHIRTVVEGVLAAASKPTPTPQDEAAAEILNAIVAKTRATGDVASLLRRLKPA
jgi:hypothetical protein